MYINGRYTVLPTTVPGKQGTIRAEKEEKFCHIWKAKGRENGRRNGIFAEIDKQSKKQKIFLMILLKINQIIFYPLKEGGKRYMMDTEYGVV